MAKQRHPAPFVVVPYGCTVWLRDCGGIVIPHAIPHSSVRFLQRTYHMDNKIHYKIPQAQDLALNEARCDWLTSTAWTKYPFFALSRVLGAGDLEGIELSEFEGRAGNYKTLDVKGELGDGRIGWSNTIMGSTVGYIAWVSGGHAHTARRLMFDPHLHFTRVDCQVTLELPDTLGVYNLKEVYANWVVNGRDKRIRATGGVDALTLVVGNRKSSPIFGRVYLKRKQIGRNTLVNRWFIRYEAELKHQLADRIATAVRRDGYNEAMNYGVSLLLGKLPVTSAVEWWEPAIRKAIEVTTNGLKLKLSNERIGQNAWFDKTVIPAIKKQRDGGDADNWNELKSRLLDAINGGDGMNLT